MPKYYPFRILLLASLITLAAYLNIEHSTSARDPLWTPTLPLELAHPQTLPTLWTLQYAGTYQISRSSAETELQA